MSASVAKQRVEVLGARPEAPVPQAVEPAPVPKRRGGRRLLMLSVPLLLAAGGGAMWLNGGRYITTDNAYVQQPLVAVSSDVAGRIVEVDAAENQPVEAGQPVFRLHPEPYRIALEESDAALASARQAVEQLRSAYATAQARLAGAQAIAEVRARAGTPGVARRPGHLGIGLAG